MNREAIAFNMKLIRSLTGMSMHEFGMKLGSISKDQIASYESGRAVPPKPTMIKVCDLAGIKEDDLVNKKIAKEDIVKEMFAAISQTQDNPQTPQDMRRLIDNMTLTIEAQKDIIRFQRELLDNFSSLTRK